MADDEKKEPEAAAAEPEEDENGLAKEEEAQVEFQPLVQLDEVKVATGEENEESIFKMRAKLFRWESDSWEKEVKMWKERGTGDVKLLQDKETGKVRLLMRREKTMKICANFFVAPEISINENAGSDRSWVWQCRDFSEEKTDMVTLAIRFANSDNAQAFEKAFKAAQETNKTKGGDAGASAGGEAAKAEEKKADSEDAKAEEKKEPEAEKKEDA